MIVTTFGSDGTKVRRPIGYPGGQCNKATAPYELFDVPGQMKKDPTPELYEPEPERVKASEQTKIGS